VSPSQSSANSNVSAVLTKSMHDHWGLYLGEGIVLILLGLAAIIFPFIAGIVATVFLGWLFLIAGIVGLVSTFRGRQAPGFGWSLLSALVALIAGTVLLWNPLQSLVTIPPGLVILTYVLIAYFIIDGILMIILAIAHRRELSGKWEWILVNGVIDLISRVSSSPACQGRSSGRSACSSGSTWCSGVPRSSPSRWRRARRRLSRDKDRFGWKAVTDESRLSC
jgi:uncharacterized membrane protein HdeD (DUF308 family)